MIFFWFFPHPPPPITFLMVRPLCTDIEILLPTVLVVTKKGNAILKQLLLRIYENYPQVSGHGA